MGESKKIKNKIKQNKTKQNINININRPLALANIEMGQRNSKILSYS